MDLIVKYFMEKNSLSNMKSILIISVILSVVLSDKLPSFMKRCKSTDQKCLKEAVQDALPKLKNGLPEFDFEAIDPAFVEGMNIAPGTGSVQIAHKYWNITMKGITDVKLTNLKFDLDKGTLFIEGVFNELTFNGMYEMSGRILLIPLNGTGPFSLKLMNGKVTLFYRFKVITRKDEKFIDCKTVSIDLNPNPIHFKLDNLFGGNRLLNDNMNNILNENWQAVFEDLKDSFYKPAADIVMTDFRNLFGRVPLSEVFLDYAKN